MIIIIIIEILVYSPSNTASHSWIVALTGGGVIITIVLVARAMPLKGILLLSEWFLLVLLVLEDFW